MTGEKIKPPREDVSKLVAEWQYLQSLAEVLKQRIDLASAAITEMESTIQAIDELSKITEEVETFFMLGTNAYARGKIIDTKKILVNIGANVLVEKSLEDAKKFFESRIDSLRRVIAETQQQLASIASRLSKLEPELRKIAESQSGG
ncbi:MAG: prefoldin subunit alpha [Candidatus Nezhaarchaeota archaeon]|nr:prefoldin subunit alpha [Candidatus Nezhaarchaeota archaeon]MCX8142122.1 prefoldin subunit alpha [Candidatus Nezhaarchaeota archaeon]MDW8050097.1 prefoldin subunit alpha [Nitrososphaerota archaeon]